MADLYDAVVRVVRGMLAAKANNLYQPGTVLAVHGDGTYSVSINGTPAKAAVPEGDVPLKAGDRIWASDPIVWTPPQWMEGHFDLNGVYVPGHGTAGTLGPASQARTVSTLRAVVHGKRVDG